MARCIINRHLIGVDLNETIVVRIFYPFVCFNENIPSGKRPCVRTKTASDPDNNSKCTALGRIDVLEFQSLGLYGYLHFRRAEGAGFLCSELTEIR